MGQPSFYAESIVRAVALLATHNEERFVGCCIDQLAEQGIEVYLIDNSSTDRTVEIAEARLGKGLRGIETFPRDDVYPWNALLARKSELASTFEADWFLHVDADEVRPSPSGAATLREALGYVDRLGYNAVNFQEFTFVPTREAPDHDHPRFQETMRRYYPFLPRFPDQLRAWKRQAEPVDLVASAGHRVAFPGLRMYPTSFPMRHYLFLSVSHAVRKYVQRRYDPTELAMGWHVVRASLRPEDIVLLPADDLRLFVSDESLDASDPWTQHPLFALGQ